MLRLTKYLKPYRLMLLASIGLLFLQANFDLALPDYLSRIVNVGIQQGGLVDAVPPALRQERMEQLLVFLDGPDRQRLLTYYTLLDQGSPNYPGARQDYPSLSGEPVYLLKDIPAEDHTWLNSRMANALVAAASLEEMLADPAKADALFQAAGLDPAEFPPGSDPVVELGSLAGVSAMVQQQLNGMQENMLIQTAVRLVRSEYLSLGVDITALQNRYIFDIGGMMLLVSLGSAAAAIVVGLLSSRAAAGLARDLRKSVFEKVTGFSNSEFDRFSTASLITRTTNDVTQIQMVTMVSMRLFFYAPIMGVGGIIRAIGKASSMWWLIALAVAVLVALVALVFLISLPKFRIMQKLVDRLNLVMRENLTGMMVIRSFNKQAFEQDRFERANNELTGTNLFVNRVMASTFPSMMLIMNALSLAIIWIGASQVAAAQIQVGDMMAFLQYAMQIVFSFLMISFMFILLPRASVSAGRIADVLETGASISDPDEPQQFPEDSLGTVEFRNVSFRYPGADENVLCNISFTALPGQTTAIIGSTGSGKSTVVNLIPRFYDVSEGAILVDGMDIRRVSQQDLRARVAYIPQKSILFSGTIEDNLLFGNEHASQFDLDEAAAVAQASDFISANAQGMGAEISQNGANVSGGQRQRLAIARALVKQAPIFIFDDSFSALDYKTDAALRRALKERVTHGRNGASTLLIVTQRVSTILDAEQIIVLDEGEISGKGTHAELMESCETYREIALSQMSLEELG